MLQNIRTFDILLTESWEAEPVKGTAVEPAPTDADAEPDGDPAPRPPDPGLG